MQRDWTTYTAEQVRKSSESGLRLVLVFAQDYEEKFNEKITCLDCIGGFEKKFNKYIESMSDKKTEAKEYQLKPKYDGIPLGFGKAGRVYNKSITKTQALFLLKNHKRGEELFSVLPKKEEKKKATPKKEA